MPNTMKALVLAQYFPSDMGGASTRASNAVKGLLSEGCAVEVVAAFPHYPYGKVPEKYRRKAIVSERFGDAKVFRVWIPGFPHNTVLNRIILHLCFVFSSLFALPFVGKADAVWAANPNLFSFFPAVVYGFVTRVSIVRNVDDLWPEVFYELGLVRSKLMQKTLDLLAWFSYIIPAAVTPISHGYKRRIIAKYGIPSGKVKVIEVGVDSVEPLNVKGRKSSEFIVMYSGVLGLGYDFNTVLEAAGLLRKYKDIVFMIRGVGELGPRLQKNIKELNLVNAVLDTDFLPKAKLSDLLHSADVFLLPMNPASFVDDGLPTKVFEYQAFGTPIVCSSEGEPARYVRTNLSTSRTLSRPAIARLASFRRSSSVGRASIARACPIVS